MGFEQPPENTGREHENEGSARRFKNGLVAELWTKDGPFWESVSEMRTRWEIDARPQLAPGDSPRIGDLVFPQSAPGWASGEFSDCVNRWIQDLGYINDRNVPPQFEDTADWNAFISACVLYDPPEESLIDFARYGDSPVVHAPYTGEPSNEAVKLPLTEAAPIRRLPSETDLKQVQSWLFARLLDEVKRDPGLLPDTNETIESILQTNFDLQFEYFKRMRELPRRWYIEVTTNITKKQVENAFDKIVGAHKPSGERGAPKRDPLVSLQCAILYDDHNERDPKDPRRKQWTYEKLAREFGLPSARSAERHVQEGRKRRRNKL